jgi:agmatinase
MSELKFLSLPNAPADRADILILPVPLERTVSFKPGTAQAPEAIFRISDQLEFFEEDGGWSPFKHLSLSVLPAFDESTTLDEAEWHARLTRHVASFPADNLFISLGGEHSITPALVAGRMPEPGTVVFLDAHADLRDSYDGSRFNHACPARRVLEQGHELLMAGIRSVFEAEVALVEQEPRISLFMDWDLRGKGQWESFLRKVSSLKGPVYLSIDMDAFSPSCVPGVGTPQPGGFLWYQVIEIVEALFAKTNIDLRGVDIVELVPEPSRASEMTAAKLLMKIVSFWGRANSFDSKPQTGSQMQVAYE